MRGGGAVSVVICAYDLGRWDQLVAAVESVLAQSEPVQEILVVVDHNAELLDRAQRHWAGTSVRIHASSGAKGLSGARNTVWARPGRRSSPSWTTTPQPSPPGSDDCRSPTPTRSSWAAGAASSPCSAGPGLAGGRSSSTG